MNFFIPEPPRNDAPKRQDVLRRRFPQSESAINSILSTANDVRYGEPISKFLNNYHFQTEEACRNFFKQYLSQKGARSIDEGEVEEYIARTLNLRCDSKNDSEHTDRSFSASASDLISELAHCDQHRGAESIMIRFIIGLTGSGKTAFSKSLFSVGLRKFWASKIIPSRVEYSRAPKFDESMSGSISDGFFGYVRECQVRDLLIYFLYSGEIDVELQKKAIRSLQLQGTRKTKIFEDLAISSANVVIDGEKTTVSRDVRREVEGLISELDSDELDHLLYEFSAQLGLSHLVSFDGFDTVDIDDFFLSEPKVPPMIAQLAAVVKSLWVRKKGVGLHSKPIRCHYLLYLRDTTFERLQPELVRSPGGALELPCNWIVPPQYEQLVHNAAVEISGSHDPKINLANTLIADTHLAFDKAVFRHVSGLTSRDHLNFAFGANARWMKRHIARTMIWALHRSAQRGEADFLRERSGVSPRWLWQQLAGEGRILQVPSYLTLEELYLNESRQLVPTLSVSSAGLEAHLARGEFSKLSAQIFDRDELTSSFGCVLNYFLPRVLHNRTPREKGGNLDVATEALPQLLLLYRALQYLKVNPRKSLSRTHGFLRKLGYEIKDDEMRFLMYVLIKNQVVMWDGSTGARHINDAPLYITIKGKILVDCIFFRTSYLSEAILNSYLLDESLGDALSTRNFSDPNIWSLDCICNATIAHHLVRVIEEVERSNAEAANLDFSMYSVLDRLTVGLSNEAAAIRSVALRQPLKHHMDSLLRKLHGIDALQADLTMLGLEDVNAGTH